MARPILEAEHQKLLQLLVLAREAAGLTQVDLAAKLNRTQSFVSKYEMGERKLDVMDFVLICRSLGLDPGKTLSMLGES